MNGTRSSSICCMVCAVLLLGSEARSTPYFSLDSFSDWNSAVGGGTISPVTTPYPALEELYGTDFAFTTPELYVMTSAESEQLDDGLVMYWGDPQAPPEIPQVASWQYTFPLDPDLTGTTLHLTVMPPPGILSVSLTLNDAAGGWASWAWSLPLLVPNAPFPIIIDPTIMGPQAGSTVFKLSVTGFDPKTAISIQADELAVGPGQWVQFPQVPVVGGVQPWNYWSAMAITPEPATLALLALGGLALIRRRRR